MKCPRCQKECNDANFCTQCGERLVARQTAEATAAEATAAESRGLAALRRCLSSKLFLAATVVFTVFYALDFCIGPLPFGLFYNELAQAFELVAGEGLGTGFYYSSGGIEILLLPAFTVFIMFLLRSRARNGESIPKWCIEVLFVLFALKGAAMLISFLAMGSFCVLLGFLPSLFAESELWWMVSAFSRLMLALSPVSLVMGISYFTLALGTYRILPLVKGAPMKKKLPVALPVVCVLMAVCNLLTFIAVGGFGFLSSAFYILLALIIIRLNKEISNDAA